MSLTPTPPAPSSPADGLDTQALHNALQQLPLALFLEVVEQSSVAISITDIDARIQYCNAAFCSLTGYQRSELQGRNHNLLASRQTPKERYQEMWQHLGSQQPWNGRLVNRRKDGSLYLAEVTVTPVVGDDGQLHHFLGMHRDISARFALEQRVHNQKALIEGVLNAAPMAVTVLDENHDVVLDNLAYKTLRTDLRGVEPIKALGYPEVGCSLPGHDETLLPLVIRGRQRWFSLVCQPLQELNEEATHYFGEGHRPCTLLLITDQTERRRQMEQSRLERLRAQVEEQKMLAAIRETLDAAIVQSQAPLNMLQAALRLDPGAGGGAQMAMQTALEAGTRSLQRLESCRPPLALEAPSEFALPPLLEDLQDLFALRLMHSPLKLLLVPVEPLPPFHGQRTRLLTCLYLLLERAWFAVREGEGIIRLSCHAEEQDICLEVEDNGPPPADLSPHRLLQPFNSLPHGELSAGIELSLVQNIVNDHKGMIEVGISKLGGCLIRFRLPMQHDGRRY